MPVRRSFSVGGRYAWNGGSGGKGFHKPGLRNGEARFFFKKTANM